MQKKLITCVIYLLLGKCLLVFISLLLPELLPVPLPSWFGQFNEALTLILLSLLAYYWFAYTSQQTQFKQDIIAQQNTDKLNHEKNLQQHLQQHLQEHLEQLHQQTTANDALKQQLSQQMNESNQLKQQLEAHLQSQQPQQLQQLQPLQQQQKMAALKRLASGMIHAQNNHLGIVIGYAELLEMKMENEMHLPDILEQQVRDYIKEINKAARTAEALNDRVRYFYRQQQNRPKPLDIEPLIRQCCAQCSTTDAQVDIVYDFSLEAEQVLLEADDFMETINHLIDNAMQAMTGNGTLTFSTSLQSLTTAQAKPLALSAGVYIMLGISDTGCGMDEDTQRQMYDPYFTTKGDQTTGLGLSQVYGFVNSSSAAITVDSAPEQGCQMTIYFPLHRQ